MNERSDASGLDSAGKRALLARLLREERRPAGPVPLSFAQRRLWLLDRVEPGRSTYNVAFAVRLRGLPNVAALESALNDIVRRHDVLRSVVTLLDGEPAHVVDRSFRLALPLVELERTDETARPAELASLLAAEGARPFDLHAGPAIRALLVRSSAVEHVLSVVIHHIVTDGWSGGIFNRELGALYNAYARGAPAALPELRATWADFVWAERERSSGERLESRLRFWKEQLSGAPPSLDLFPLRPAPAIRTSRGRSTSRTLGTGTAAALERVCRARRTTLFSTLFAALVALLHRYCGSRDIVIGTGGANRTRSEYEDLIGFFVNTVALRTRFEGDPAFCDLLAQVHRAAIDAFDDGDVPFEKLIEELHPARTGSRTPLVNVMFVLQNTPGYALVMDGLDVSPVALERSTAKFDLTFEVRSTATGFDLLLEYSTDLFDTATATALLEAYESLIAGVAEDCERPLSQLPLLSSARMHEQLVAWNDTARAMPGLRLERHFEAQARRSPDATALVAGTARLTYRALNERANRLARRLQASGVRRGSRVGLCAERGASMVSGMLAILKAGAAYVPLDPEYPRERLAFMARDADVNVVLAERRFMNRLKAPTTDVSYIDLDTALEPFAGTNLESDGTGDDLAYVMYTSGSTGTPKGVLIPHRAVERLAIDPNYVSIAAGAVVAQAATFSFDASTFELWGALCNGATLVIVPKLVALSARALAAFIATHRIGIMFVTTSLFAEIVREAPATFRGLSYLLIGGEALSASLVARLYESEHPPNVLNMYGPTEATTFAAYHRLEALPPEGMPVPIGRPVSNTYLRVLDERRALLPAGACGELYVGGPGLALGYANDPQRTARAFVRDPYSPRPADRLYATGDRVRYLPSGELEFLGRIDGQVKVRGFRIEPAEVEAALRRCSGVHDAVLAVRSDPSGNAKLVAYVTAGSGHRVDPHDVARTLRKRLPAHMVPEAIVPLARFPQAATGKVDRAALPAPGASHTGRLPAAQPTSELHVQLAALWKRLLEVEDVGVCDDFFALGGHSLLAARMVAEVDRTFGTQLPLSVLFEEPTIERLAEVLQGAPESFNRAPLVRLNDGGTATPLYFLHGSLTGGGYYCIGLARQLGEDRPVCVLRPHGVDGRPLPDTIETMAADYVAIVKAAQPSGPYHLGGYCSGGLVAYEMARLLRARGDDVASVVLIDPRDPLPALCAVAAAIEGLGLPEPVSRAARSFAARLLARIRLHLNRFAASSSKGAFLRERASRIAARFAGAPREDALKEWRRVTDAFIPRRYDGPLTVLTSEETAAAPGSKPLRWNAIARAELHVIPGGHFTCVTDFVADAAAHIARALDPARDAG